MDEKTVILGDFGFSRVAGDLEWTGGTFVTASPLFLLTLATDGRMRVEATREDDLWSVATLCLHAEDGYAFMASHAIIRRFATGGKPHPYTATEVLRLWETWGNFDPRRYGAVRALLDSRIASPTAGGTGSVYDRLHRILSEKPRPIM